MPIQAVLDEGAHGALDESLKSLYVQNTDTKEFHLDIGPEEAAKLAHHQRQQLESKKADLKRIHDEKNDLVNRLKVYEELGKSAEEIKQSLESNRPEEITKLVESHKAEVESLKKSFEEPLSAAKTQVDRMRQQIESSLAASAIAKARTDFDLNETADYVLRDYVKVITNDDGEYSVKVFENGQPALIAGQEKTVDQLIKGFREEKRFLAMFNAPEAGGGGTHNSRQPTPGGKKEMKRSDYDAGVLAGQSFGKFFSEGGVIID